MMILVIIFILSIIHLALYYLNAKVKVQIPDYIIFVILFLANFFILPRYFYPAPSETEVLCGNPIIAITFVFWLLNSITTVIIYLIWTFLLRKKLFK